mmetsp:Transcript_10373/g.26381  ORF Transcript_10373/g.26381 Transcript_10373/m.26381 type:complete len:239 (-) Transcript_10373:373-1089(-)
MGRESGYYAPRYAAPWQTAVTHAGTALPSDAASLTSASLSACSCCSAAWTSLACTAGRAPHWSINRSAFARRILTTGTPSPTSCSSGGSRCAVVASLAPRPPSTAPQTSAKICRLAWLPSVAMLRSSSSSCGGISSPAVPPDVPSSAIIAPACCAASVRTAATGSRHSCSAQGRRCTATAAGSALSAMGRSAWQSSSRVRQLEQFSPSCATIGSSCSSTGGQHCRGSVGSSSPRCCTV